MAEYYSTQATIEARISSFRLTGHIDFDDDDSPDAASLTAAYKFARGLIRGKLEDRFGSTIIDTWDSDTVPELVQIISDDLCIYQIMMSNVKLAPVLQIIYTNAKDMLTEIADGKIGIYGTDGPTDDEWVTERTPSDYDPERELDDMTARTTWVNSDARELDGY